MALPHKLKVYSTLKQCSAVEGIPIKKLKIAKNELAAPGFRNNHVYMLDFENWLSIPANVESLEKLYQASLPNIRERDGRTKEDVEFSLLLKEEVLKDLEIKKKSGEYLDPGEVNEFLTKLRLSFESVINGWCTELPSKTVGKPLAEIEEIIKKEKHSLFTNFRTQIQEKMKDASGDKEKVS